MAVVAATSKSKREVKKAAAAAAAAIRDADAEPYSRLEGALTLHQQAISLLSRQDHTAVKVTRQRILQLAENARSEANTFAKIRRANLDIALSCHDLGIAYTSLSDFMGAQPIFERAWNLRTGILGPEDPHTCISRTRVGANLVRDF